MAVILKSVMRTQMHSLQMEAMIFLRQMVEMIFYPAGKVMIKLMAEKEMIRRFIMVFVMTMRYLKTQQALK